MLNSSEAEQQRRSKEIDKCLYREKTYVKRLVKILLLGAGESGKSTFLKQMRIIHGQDWDRSAREEFRATIYSNVIKGTVVGGGLQKGGREAVGRVGRGDSLGGATGSGAVAVERPSPEKTGGFGREKTQS